MLADFHHGAVVEAPPSVAIVCAGTAPFGVKATVMAKGRREGGGWGKESTVSFEPGIRSLREFRRRGTLKLASEDRADSGTHRAGIATCPASADHQSATATLRLGFGNHSALTRSSSARLPRLSALPRPLRSLPTHCQRAHPPSSMPVAARS